MSKGLISHDFRLVTNVYIIFTKKSFAKRYKKIVPNKVKSVLFVYNMIAIYFFCYIMML